MKFKHLALATLILGSLTAYAVDKIEPEATQSKADDLAQALQIGQSFLSFNQYFEEEGVDSFEMINSLEAAAEDKNSFKRRASPYTYIHNLAMSIETNFPVPFVGSQNYFGRIYFLEGNAAKIDYRDEQIANKHYDSERKKPRDFYTQAYQVATITSKKGLDLVNAAGAVVNLRADSFSPAKGGRLYLKVKAPKTDVMNMVMDVVVTGRSVQNYVVVGTQKYPFTSFTINADKSFLAGTSILNGILSVEFNQNGRFSYSIKP